MKNKKFLIVAVIAILIVGVVSVFAFGIQNKSWYSHKWMGYDTCKQSVGKATWLDKGRHNCNLTDTQMVGAKKGFWQKDNESYENAFRGKLGLLDDATDEEVNEAMMNWKEENNHYSNMYNKCSGCSKKAFCGK